MSETKQPSAEEQPTLCTFFSQNKHVDPAAQAFFDNIAHGNEPQTSSTPKEDDSFSASLQASESDRRHDAWIPSERCQQALSERAKYPAGGYSPEQNFTTMPGIVHEEDLVDPVKAMLTSYMGEESAKARKTLSANDVPQNNEGLRKLIELGNHRAAINLTGRLLALHGQGIGKAGQPSKITPDILQVWFVRIALLIKLRMFAVAELEAASFGSLDQPDLYYGFYPDIYGSRIGSMVPFGFRILLAELPMHLGQFSEALNRLHVILNIVNQILENLKSGFAENGDVLEMTEVNRTASLTLWKQRWTKIKFSILNCLLAQKDYFSAVEVVQSLDAAGVVSKRHLHGLLGRIFLQLGDVKAAQENFRRAAELDKDENPSEHFMNSGLMNVALNKFDEAYERFKEASELNSQDPVAINNMAVCLLYLGRLRDALALLKGTVQRVDMLHEGILFNLSTLFELESSQSAERKQSLLQSVSANLGDGFNVACLKLPMPP